MTESDGRKQLFDLIKGKEVLVFDFDGVLVDSVEVKTDAFAELYRSYGQDVMDRVVAHHRANGGMTRFEKFRHYHQAFLGLDITEEEVERLSGEFSNIVVNKVVNASEIPGAIDFLKKWYQEKICFVNSATPEDEIRDIVKQRRWDHFFVKVYGAATSKFENLNKIIETHPEFNKEDFLFFGDAMSDLNAAVKAGVDFIGIGDTQSSILARKVPNERLFADFKILNLLSPF